MIIAFAIEFPVEIVAALFEGGRDHMKLNEVFRFVEWHLRVDV
jgi:hypothetical protein